MSGGDRLWLDAQHVAPVGSLELPDVTSCMLFPNTSKTRKLRGRPPLDGRPFSPPSAQTESGMNVGPARRLSRVGPGSVRQRAARTNDRAGHGTRGPLGASSFCSTERRKHFHRTGA